MRYAASVLKERGESREFLLMFHFVKGLSNHISVKNRNQFCLSRIYFKEYVVFRYIKIEIR